MASSVNTYLAQLRWDFLLWKLLLITSRVWSLITYMCVLMRRPFWNHGRCLARGYDFPPSDISPKIKLWMLQKVTLFVLLWIWTDFLTSIGNIFRESYILESTSMRLMAWADVIIGVHTILRALFLCEPGMRYGVWSIVHGLRKATSSTRSYQSVNAPKDGIFNHRHS